MDDEQEGFISISNESPFSMGSLAGINLHPKNYWLLYHASEDLRQDTTEHLRARITPGELAFIEHMCQHPEQTDEEATAAVGLRESTVLAYYAHLGRNFNVHNSSDLRKWAFENRLVTPASDDPPEEEGTDEGFDPWVRRF